MVLILTDHLNKKEAIGRFRDIIETSSEFWIGCTAVEIGIFDIISNRKVTVHEISKQNKWNESIIEALCNCLVSYGYLEKDNNLYYLSKFSDRYLAKNSPDYLGFFLESAHLFNVFSQLTENIVSGKELIQPNGMWKPITKISALIGEEIPNIMLEKFPFLLKEDCRILDLGCGRMHQSIQLAKSNPKITVIGIESNDETIEDVNDTLKKENLESRIKIIKEDLTKFDTNLKFDIIFFNHILHCLPHEVNVEILNKSQKWLKEGGYMFIFDDLLLEDKTAPKESVKKNLLANMLGSKIYSIPELEELLVGRGFENIESLPLRRRIVITGKKIK
ncbi:MAG: hypothetical protein A7315_10130 [Candidatus Altiarchaeales archaeon WOR_SM1_79]|nr:MAG: hypothetical protein A7315_10130 [Candidatus Altiarchaeales archaeon WOR_SM1_79]